jgi:hypothetical protein
MNGEIGVHTRKMAGMTAAQRLRYLQALIGPPSSDKQELQFRALLVTALNETGIWPPRAQRQAA